MLRKLREKFLAQELNDLEIEISKIKMKNLHITHELASLIVIVKENEERINSSNILPLLVATVSEIFIKEKDNKIKKNKISGIIIKTSNKLNIFLKNSGLLELEQLQINGFVAVNRDNYFIIRKLPIEYDCRVKAMEIDDKPTQTYHDIGGLDNQIQELIEAIIFPLTQSKKFQNLGIRPPKGVLLYGPPGMGKTLLARACAAQTNAAFLKLAGPQLVQMYIGEGACLIREAFELAKEKQPTIIFIDEVDAIGTKRFDSNINGDREVQRTMLELLNQLDGFTENINVKVIAATNRVDILDPALLRSGRLDRKIEFPYPDRESRKRILQIHVRKLKISNDVNLEEISSISSGFNGSQLRAICIEAGMNTIRYNRKIIQHQDFLDALMQIKLKKKITLEYYG
nr:26S protease regulatory SU 6A [Cryptomonas sp.]